jgi:hypothetical protein
MWRLFIVDQVIVSFNVGDIYRSFRISFACLSRSFILNKVFLCSVTIYTHQLDETLFKKLYSFLKTFIVYCR